MKKIIAIITCILLGITMSQAQVRYRIKVDGNAYQRTNANCAEFGVEVFLSDGDTREAHRQPFIEGVRFDASFDKIITVPDGVTVGVLRFWASRRVRNSCNGDRPNGQFFFPLVEPYTCFYSTPAEHGTGIFGDGLWEANLTIAVEPLVEVLSPGINDFLPLDQKIQINATPGFPERLEVYNWQYSINNGVSFQDVPAAFNGRSSMDVSAEDILGTSTAQSNLGNQIQFLIESCSGRRQSVTPRTYTIVPATPTFSDKSEELTTCYDGNDGSVRFTFSRELFPGEKMVILPTATSTTFPSTPDIETLQLNPVTGRRDSYTIENLPRGNYEATVLGFYGAFNTYTDGVGHNMNFSIGRPSVVQFDITESINSRCNDNDGDPDTFNDGEILITASGGNPGVFQYSYQLDGGGFSTFTDFDGGGTEHRMTDLKPGNYEIRVQKSITGRGKSCIAYVLNASNEPTSVVKTVPITITEPDEQLQIEYIEINEPRAYGFEDGRISARIFGGTAFPTDGSYRFEWRKGSVTGEILTTTNTEALSGDQGFLITLHSIGAGKYYLNVWDAKFDEAKYDKGCFMIDSEYELKQPDPLEVKIEILNEISCNITNEYSNGRDFDKPLGTPDQFQDGALRATVTGGVAFDRSISNNIGQCRLPSRGYCYSWKKEVNGIWQDVYDQNDQIVNDSIIEFQSVGDYALNIEDANGIQLGIYEWYIVNDGSEKDGSREYRLIRPTDSIRNLPQPDKLELSFSSTPVTCTSGNNGTASVSVTGGSGEYKYKWNNGATGTNISGLFAGIYRVTVTDKNGCVVKGSVTVDQPNGLKIETATIKNPTCFEGNDGSLTVSIEGGVKPYTIKWNTGSTINTISNLTQGTYVVEVIDANDCKAFYEDTLIDPDPIVVDMPETRALCADQTLDLDIAIDDSGATYLWSGDNGFTSTDATVEITKAGRYTATITSSLGCIGTGSIEVDVFDTPIDADFLITTQAYVGEDIILVNVSEPIGEKVEWTIPEGIEVISKADDQLVLKFDKEGPHDILLTSHQGDCYQEYTKTIIVQPEIESPLAATGAGEFIEEYIVYPNPNKGSFKAKVTLAEDASITIKIINLMSGMTVHERSEKGNKDFLLDYSISMPTGVYLMLLETPRGSETRKLVFE